MGSVSKGNLQHNDKLQSAQAAIRAAQAHPQSNFPWQPGSGGENGTLKED
jgi:hypothetical protein